ncbi:MAG: hypothetical protein L6R37_002944 [Teloschistes peruensis]|nr:MAG: hypothetical protein L6R37_002944 [Teloschistes peruensis]
MSAKSTRNKVDDLADIKGLIRERPWLLPSNRKLRHLEGITLRNLSFSQPSTPKQSKTTDDELLPSTLKTPTKLLALREKKLEHSRSSIDLHSSSKNERPLAGREEPGGLNKGAKLNRPQIGNRRRRSTLDWTNAPPQVRQKKLEDVAEARLADTWFSLDCDGISEPIYVSEIVGKAMNFNFRFFDLNTYGPWVTRRDQLTIKIWARTEDTEPYRPFLELQVHMRSLQFIGKSLENFRHPLPQNCVLLHLSDGIYTSFTDLPLDEPVLPAPVGPKNGQSGQPTSTFDELMRLSNLDNCVEDALATREKLTAQINALLQKQKIDRDLIQSAAQAQDSLATTQRAVSIAQKQIKAGQARRSEVQKSLRARRDAIGSGTLAQRNARSILTSAREEYVEQQQLHRETQFDSRGQIRRICEDLFQIYPVEPIPKKTLAFTIRGLPLPNATSPSSDAATTAAALGCVAHVTYLLSLYTSASLPYPVTANGSSSTIYDPVSSSLQSEASRMFPLQPKGTARYRFEYGVFLLNTDIELLMSKQGVRTVDLRHTLPNLKYLLTVLTSGKGELPGRKEGRSGLRSALQGEGLDRESSTDGSLLEEGNDGTLSMFKSNGKNSIPRIQSPLGKESRRSVGKG